MKQDENRNYQFITDNPSIYNLTIRLNDVYDAIKEEKDAISEICNLLSAIPESIDKRYDITSYVDSCSKDVDKIIDTEKVKVEKMIEWSSAHKNEVLQNKSKEANRQMYQLIAKKVSSIIDEMYIAGVNSSNISAEVLNRVRSR